MSNFSAQISEIRPHLVSRDPQTSAILEISNNDFSGTGLLINFNFALAVSSERTTSTTGLFAHNFCLTLNL